MSNKKSNTPVDVGKAVTFENQDIVMETDENFINRGSALDTTK